MSHKLPPKGGFCPRECPIAEYGLITPFMLSTYSLFLSCLFVKSRCRMHSPVCVGLLLMRYHEKQGVTRIVFPGRSPCFIEGYMLQKVLNTSHHVFSLYPVTFILNQPRMKCISVLFALLCAVALCSELRMESSRPFGRSLEESSIPFTGTLSASPFTCSLWHLGFWLPLY